MDRLNALEKEWSDEPMTHILLAAFMGYEKPKPRDIRELLDMFPSGEISTNV